jgi:hypothetical protein
MNFNLVYDYFLRPFMRRSLSSSRGIWIVRGVKKLAAELSISILATLIVTALLSHLLFSIPTVPAALNRSIPSALIFSPNPVAPASFNLQSPNIVGEVANTGLGRDKLARDRGVHRIPHAAVPALEPAPTPTPIPPPLQLSGASVAHVMNPEKPPGSDGLLKSVPTLSTVSLFKPLQTMVGQLSWLLPK